MFNFSKKAKEDPKDLKEVIDYLKKVESNMSELSRELENLKEASKFSVQKVGMVRFSPYKEVGGDQSFSIALLDADNSGIVISSLFSRTDNRVYGKPIVNGQSKYLLSEEEKQAIEKANNPQSLNNVNGKN